MEVAGNTVTLQPALDEQPKNISFSAEVQCHYMAGCCVCVLKPSCNFQKSLIPIIRLVAGDLLREVHACQSWPVFCGIQKSIESKLARKMGVNVGGITLHCVANHTDWRATVPNSSCKAARINTATPIEFRLLSHSSRFFIARQFEGV